MPASGDAGAKEWILVERLFIAARCCGAALRLVDMTAEWAQEREAFGSPIAEYQGISFPLADSLTELHAARLLTYHAAHAFDVLEDRKVVHGKVSMAKLFASEMAGRVADRAVQALGGRGYMTENAAARFYRELRVDRIWEGTSEIQRSIISRGVFKRGAAAYLDCRRKTGIRLAPEFRSRKIPEGVRFAAASRRVIGRDGCSCDASALRRRTCFVTDTAEVPTMKRLLLLTAAGLTVVALAGAVGLPDLAGAQDATATPDTITVSGVGTVDAVPNEAQMSFGAETRKPTAQAAVAANADAMRKIINALRQAGGRELATQWVSVYPYTDDTGNVTGYSASNSVSAVSDVGDAPALIDAAAEAGANQINGPGLSSSNAEALYRQALAKAVDAARLNAEALAKASGRSLGSITTIVEGGATSPEPMYRTAAQADSSTPIVPGEQKTTATVSITFSLR